MLHSYVDDMFMFLGSQIILTFIIIIIAIITIIMGIIIIIVTIIKCNPEDNISPEQIQF